MALTDGAGLFNKSIDLFLKKYSGINKYDNE
jgi:hypothetical protein